MKCNMKKNKLDETIIVLFHGGLGNQMYQYCFYRWLGERYPNKRILADISEYRTIECHQGFELVKIFPHLKLNIATNYELYKIYGEIPRIYSGIGKSFVENKIRKKINNNLFGSNVENIYEEPADCTYIDVQEAIKERKKYFSGYWQNKFFFLTCKNILLKEFVFSDIKDSSNLKCLDLIEKNLSVSLHVRRGDYVDAGWPVLSMDYYYTAMAKIRDRVTNPLFFIFSDDVDYVEKKFADLKNKIVMRNNWGENSYIDMFLMSKCKHNIIANSTFSIWAALLNRNTEKIVIYPEQSKDKQKMLDGWIRIKA